MLDKLRYLIALAQAQHFTHAAELCGVSQASLSNGIRSLEEILGAVLVNRSGGFRGFTSEGERALMWAHRIVAHVQGMERDIRGVRDAHLRIGVVHSVIPLLSETTVPFLVQYPDTHLTVLVRSSEDILDMLQASEIDIGLTYRRGNSGIISVPLEVSQFVLVTTPEGPLGRAKAVTWQEIAEVPYGLLVQRPDERQLINEIFRKMRIQFRPVFEADCVEALLDRVRLGHLVGLLPYAPDKVQGKSNTTRMVPIESRGLHPVYAVARANISETSIAAVFLNELSNAFGFATTESLSLRWTSA